MADKALLSSQLGSPSTALPRHRNRPLAHIARGIAVLSMLLLSFQIFHHLSPRNFRNDGHCMRPETETGTLVVQSLSRCPAQNKVSPVARPDITEKNVNQLFKSDSFQDLSVQRLSGAIQVPTETFEDLGRLGEDKRWDVFYSFEKYLRKTFPLLHEKLHLELVNEHGLLYTWQGSDEQLKPILLMAHQDTVPVAADTLSEWKYPPYSGHFDGQFIYGRGSQDCKNNLIAILSSITSLLDQDFVPRRTVVLSFGFDEETSGFQYGAARLSKRITDIWGPDSFAIIVDEGQTLIVDRFGRSFGIPQVSERGYFDLEVTVHIPGGHSSIPPAHTSIGILAQAVTTLENAAEANFPLELRTDNPFYTLLQCAAEDPSTEMPNELRDAIGDPQGTSQIVKLLSHDPIIKSLFHTTQAVTIFQGGNKANALPAFANGLINYRVSSTETVGQVREKLINTLKPVADKFGLKFTAGPKPGVGEPPAEVPEYTLALSWNNAALESSPVTSTDSPTWSALSGVIKHVFDEPVDGGDVTVAPMQIIGNTDTRYYWDLSPQIYRFGPGRDRHNDGPGGIHDVNEHVPIEVHLEAILFFHEFIRVFDEADLE
ncbi:unnamed protein product [Clonostachys rhizophaga]|uniref:Peptidase M20 dimerisation domain-containing protein n=1 Tax=Clonostachys rhizophaga TaxID=160324 RepID=A0A9N9YTK8_9HYPO|nr:unnamed protein product [Clonostachys rhizophaga]